MQSRYGMYDKIIRFMERITTEAKCLFIWRFIISWSSTGNILWSLTAVIREAPSTGILCINYLNLITKLWNLQNA